MTIVEALGREVTRRVAEVCYANPTITGSDVLQMYLTLARHAVIVARRAGARPEDLRALVLTILAECADDTKH